ncbi:MAG: NAD(+) diphosphatase [Alphaproteobacteria bacterium]|nr:NAD(+) diphosphatase [Alphaproteobacteria bacterium]MBV9373150.1 NAD(+) diphosphatase [Alphaproteobacteria bacterium]MBV9900239.1 NAD(+) diphosphatase [Alphaproteobacteria bacterium]
MPSPGFTGAGIDRADRLRLDEARLAELAAAGEARLLRLAGLDPVLDEAERLAWDSLGSLDPEAETIFLGLSGDIPLFAPVPAIEIGQRAWGVFSILGRMAPSDAALWGAARSVIEWHNRHRFCGRCGAPTVRFRAGWGRRCTACTLEHFPRVDPVVIMLAEFDGRVLLGRQPQYPAGRYSALAGFVEPGESIEEAVAREIEEEAGLRVADVRYVASQPWPFPGQLMIACIARAASDAVTLDRNELEDAIWADRAEVAAALADEAGAPFKAPPAFAIAHSLLRAWVDGLAPSDGPA